LTPLEDVFNYYKKIYKYKAEEFNPKDLRRNYLGSYDEEFYKYLNEDKITFKITKLSSNKACGIDGIHSVMLKTLLGTDFPKLLLYLYQMCIKFGMTPKGWNESVTFPIPKKKKSSYIKDFRPISITNTFRKVFEGLLLDYMNTKLKKELKLCGNQAGFRSGYSTLTHAIASNETAQSYNPKQHHVFLDLKKAYDTVPIKMLMKKLEKRNLPKGILSLIASLFSGCTTRIIVNQEITNEIEIQRGLLQGAILSP
jgi:hypothetical protein